VANVDGGDFIQEKSTKSQSLPSAMPRRTPDTVAEDAEAPPWTCPLRCHIPRTTDLYGAYGESLANDAVKLEKTRAIAFRHAELRAHKRRLAVARDTSATTSAVREFIARELRMRRGQELDPSVVRRKALNPETTTCMFGDVDFMHYHSSGSADWLEGLGAFESSAGSSGSGGDRDSNTFERCHRPQIPAKVESASGGKEEAEEEEEETTAVAGMPMPRDDSLTKGLEARTLLLGRRDVHWIVDASSALHNQPEAAVDTGSKRRTS